MDTLINNYITFPCNGKRPCTLKWNLLTQAVPKKQGNPNYGILTGKANNIMVVDCDLIKATEDKSKYFCGVEAWKILTNKFSGLKSLGIPTVQTKSGGLHLYFKYDPDLASGIQKLNGQFFNVPNKTIKIDILSDNKFVVGPGSNGYKFIHNTQFCTPPTLPMYLFDILSPVKHESDDDLTGRGQINEIDDQAKERAKITKEALKYIVDGIPASHSDNYDQWIRVIWGIADTAKKNNYDALDLADEFSQLSDKYKNVQDVRQVYAQSNGKITFGTLAYLSGNSLRQHEQCLQDCEEGDQNANIEFLIEDFKVFNSCKDIDQIFSIKEQGDTRIFSVHMNDGGKKDIEVIQSNMLTSENEQQSKRSLGYLRPSVDIQYDLSVIHPEFGEESKCILKDLDTIDFVHKSDINGEHRIRVKHPWDKKRSYITKHSHAKQLGKMQRNKQAVDVLLNDALKPGCYQVFKDRYNITINCQNFINTYVAGEQEKKIRSESQFINDLLEAHPGIVDYFKFCDNSKFGSFDGLFVCSSISGLWKREHNGRVDKMIESRIKKYVPGLNEHEIKFVETHSNIQNLRKMFTKEIIDDAFENNIDENLDVFATTHGIFDTTSMTFRKTLPIDYAMTHCGWKYDKDLSEQHYEDVKSFFNMIFPIQSEREVFLTFIASLLHGHRLDKKFMILTDKRDGNNGKSTVLNFLRVFFGDYLKSSTKFICRGAFDKDKDSHDGGLEPLKGKRVMLADELKKNMKLDEGLIKNLAGGKYVVEGRRFGKVDQFKFTWQAGIIMVFNDGDCPKFDSTDKAFMERMLVCPMRSKFIARRNNERPFGQEDYTYELNPTIDKHFELWRSAFLDLLIKYCKIDGLCEIQIPISMREWKEDIISGNNELADWIFENVELTDNVQDVLSLNDLKDKYKQGYGLKTVSDRNFIAIAKALFTSKGFEINERYQFRVNGTKKEKRNAILRVKLIDEIN